MGKIIGNFLKLVGEDKIISLISDRYDSNITSGTNGYSAYDNARNMRTFMDKFHPSPIFQLMTMSEKKYVIQNGVVVATGSKNNIHELLSLNSITISRRTGNGGNYIGDYGHQHHYTIIDYVEASIYYRSSTLSRHTKTSLFGLNTSIDVTGYNYLVVIVPIQKAEDRHRKNYQLPVSEWTGSLYRSLPTSENGMVSSAIRSITGFKNGNGYNLNMTFIIDISDISGLVYFGTYSYWSYLNNNDSRTGRFNISISDLYLAK